MADGNRVFVSPGVYTSEKDLTFVAQSVGVTTLGLVGEALKGPAFEPIFIQNYDDFTTRFGGTSPTTYVDSQIPKYELGYIAKSYLSQSNQLFVTRVLGLSGYDAGPSWSVQTIGSLDPSTFTGATTAYTSGTTRLPFYIPLTGSNVTVGSEMFSNAGLSTDFISTLPNSIKPHFGNANATNPLLDWEETIYLTNGTSTTLKADLLSWATAIYGIASDLGSADVGTGKYLATGATYSSCTGSNPSNLVSATTPFYGGAIYQYGVLPIEYTNLATATTTNSLSATSSTTLYNRLGVDSDTALKGPLDYENDAWYYGLFDYTGSSQCCSGTTYSGVSYQLYATTATTGSCQQISTGTTSIGGTAFTVFSGYCAVDYVDWGNVKPYEDYDGMVVLTLRSRGLSTKKSGGPLYEVTANTVSFDCSGGTYERVLEDPFASFGINAQTTAGRNYSFKTSMNVTSKDYASSVFGVTPFDKQAVDVPLFVEESYPTLLKDSWRKGKVRGLQCCLTYLPSARAVTNTNTIAWYMHEWLTPETPYVVSELQGSDVFRLFKFVSISDGTTANREYKVSLINLSFERGEFDVVIRDFYDTDANPVVLEKYTRCSLDPTKVSFIGRKIGTSTGEFELKSRYTMLFLGEGVLDGIYAGSLPCGFEGYRFRSYGNCPINPRLVYKTKYYTPGEVVYDPPFGTGTVNNATISGGDKVSKVYLGISDSMGAGYDPDFFDHKGYVVPSNVCTATAGGEWSVITQGFHMDSGATVVVGGSGTYVNWSGTSLNGKPVFECGVTSFSKEPTLSTDPYKKLRARKFTVAPHGGFDGWDIYRKTRTNTDDYRLGLTGYLNGACVSTEFPTAKGDGSFKKLNTTEANTDYFAYLRGINEYSNPESVDINVFATPGIDYVDNLGLVNEAIDMVETDRADSLYVVTTPDYNMFVPNTTVSTNAVSPDEAVDNLEDSLIDSNYTATYYPWIQIRDAANNKQIYIPPTSEVMRNIALTDNISFPWFASAGYTRGLVNATKARKKLTLDERDTLYVGRLNPIATFSDTGPIIWGNKTLQVRESALDRINVRRLLLQTRKLISAVAVRLIFEQNDEIVRQQFLDLVNPILDSIRRDRGLTDFRVVLSNDPQEIDRNEMNGKIYIKPTRALEYIFVEFLITPTGASFEDI